MSVATSKLCLTQVLAQTSGRKARRSSEGLGYRVVRSNNPDLPRTRMAFSVMRRVRYARMLPDLTMVWLTTCSRMEQQTIQGEKQEGDNSALFDSRKMHYYSTTLRTFAARNHYNLQPTLKRVLQSWQLVIDGFLIVERSLRPRER